MDDLQYWVIGWSLALCAVAFFMVMVPVYVVRHVGAGKIPPLGRGRVSIRGLGVVDTLGVGLFFGLYAALWLGMEMVEGEDVEVTPALLVGQLVFQAFLVGVVVLFLFWRVGLVEFLGLQWRQWWLAPVIAVGVLVLMLMVGVVLSLAGYESWMADLQQVEGAEDTQQDVVRMIKESTDPLTFFFLALVACIGAPLSEEIVFRGYIYPVVKRFSNITGAVLFTGLLFAAVHGNLAALLPLFILGVMLALSYEWTGSIWTPIAVHALFNTFQVILMRLMTMYPEMFEGLEKAREAAWLVVML